MLQALVEHLVGLAQQRPLLIIFEDVHWADPTSLEFLDLALNSLGPSRVLLLITTRPTFEHQLAGAVSLTQLTLERLGRQSSHTMIEQLLDDRLLPAAVLDNIVNKADGVPLFIEELTKSVLESSLSATTVDKDVQATVPSGSEIPSSLRDSLTARLDRLPATAKYVAQIAACIGREFDYPLLAAVAQLDDQGLQTALGQLAAAQLVFQRGIVQRAHYMFKHALVRDAAYESLLRARKKALHCRIAEVLETNYLEIVARQPELLAYHFAAGANHDKAVQYWIKASHLALEHSANKEALVHAEQGHQRIASTSPSPLLENAELELQFAKSMALRALYGFTSSEYRQAVQLASDLAIKLKETDIAASCARGLLNHYFTRGDQNAAKRVCQERLLPLLKRHPEQVSAEGVAIGANHLYLGELENAKDVLEETLATCLPADRYSQRHYVLNPVTAGLANLSLTHWLLGNPEQALQTGATAVNTAQHVDQPLSFVMAVAWVSIVHRCCGTQNNMHRIWVEEAIKMAADNSFQMFAPRLAFIDGQYDVANGQLEVGFKKMQDAFNTLSQQGFRLAWTVLITELITDYIDHRHIADYDTLLANAFEHMEHNGERNWQAELYRLKGELLLHSKDGNLIEAQNWFEKSLTTATQQQAKAWQLRTTTSLARLYYKQGKNQQAHALLEPACHSFSEGFDTVDVKNAKALLDVLS